MRKKRFSEVERRENSTRHCIYTRAIGNESRTLLLALTRVCRVDVFPFIDVGADNARQEREERQGYAF